MSDSITKDVFIAAPVARVWQALTDHHEFGQWFGVALDGPFAAGTPSTGHMTIKGYEHIAWNADVITMEPTHRFAYRWRPYALDPNVDYSAEPKTLVEFTLSEENEGTRLIVTESGFNGIPAHRRDEAYRMNNRGWTAQVENIRTHVEN
ncbi:MAG: SRPBCC family protein [Sphingomicrobium sp.]